MRYLIYALVDPRTQEVRYIGKSSSGLRRPRRHGSAQDLLNSSYKVNWLKALIIDGLKPEIRVLEVSSQEHLNADEIRWIAYGRSRGWRLTNLGPGGEGGGHPMSVETRAKQSAVAKGRSKSVSHRAALADAQRGKKLSMETRVKMSAVAKVRAADPVERARLATLRTGRTNSPEARAKVRAANLGLVHSAERCEKNRQARLGKRLSAETKEKMRAVHRAKFMADPNHPLRMQHKKSPET